MSDLSDNDGDGPDGGDGSGGGREPRLRRWNRETGENAGTIVDWFENGAGAVVALVLTVAAAAMFVYLLVAGL